jgi:peptide/nickel transport system permease protein
MSVAPTRMRQAGALNYGILIIVLGVTFALAASFVAPFDPSVQDPVLAFQPPNALRWFGADNLGRDVLSRVLYATRLNLALGVLAVFPPFVIGCAIGLVAGYFGGILDRVPMSLLDVNVSFPFLVLILAILSVFGPGLPGFFIAVALVGWVNYARLTRFQTRMLKTRDFITAARALGFGHGRILVLHILPNAVLPTAVLATSDMALFLVLGATFGYLGLGASPSTPELGAMIAAGQPFLAKAWWICLFPGLAIVMLALGFRLLADGMVERLGTRG